MTKPSSTSLEPQELTPVVREFIADTLTPISAYIALAQPGRSCLLESVEGGERISRYSFIGLDYMRTASFTDDSRMLEKIRELIGSYRFRSQDAADSTTRLPFPGGAVCIFTYDAARIFEHIGSAPPADATYPDALVFIPGT